jgi:hypothetical protein
MSDNKGNFKLFAATYFLQEIQKTVNQKLGDVSFDKKSCRFVGFADDDEDEDDLQKKPSFFFGSTIGSPSVSSIKLNLVFPDGKATIS